MANYKLYKNKKVIKLPYKIELGEGYYFAQKVKIIIYSKDILKKIIIKKMNNSLKKLIRLYLIEEQSDDGDTTNILEPLEELKLTFFRDYYNFLEEEDIIKYARRLNKLEMKCGNKKSRRL